MSVVCVVRVVSKGTTKPMMCEFPAELRLSQEAAVEEQGGGIHPAALGYRVEEELLDPTALRPPPPPTSFSCHALQRRG